MDHRFEVPDRRRVAFVSTVRPTRAQRRTALVVACVSLAVFALLAPFAKMQLPVLPAFLPLYQSALIVFDLITSVLLLGQFRILRSNALLVLAAGYVFSALLATAHALSFPGLFAQGGAIGAGPQTTAWLYFMWHAGFALFVLAYAVTNDRDADSAPTTHGKAVFNTFRLAVVSAAIPVISCTTFHDQLPPIMLGNGDGPLKLAVAFVTWCVGIGALLMLWRRRSRTVLDLWLMVVMCVWIADTALSAVLNHARFDVGWYAGRAYGLLANGFVLGVLLLESGTLYARLARSNRLLGNTLAEMRRLNGDLQAFAGSLAHDLQQPLITIASFAQVIQRGPLGERDAAHLAKIIGATETAREMIRALLEFARLGESELHSGPVDLRDVVAQARQAVSADAQGKEIEWNIAPLPVVWGDASLLLLVFINLLSNAVKYSRGQQRPAISVDVEALPDGSHAIRVRDNGVGFDMSQAERLFTPFERLHPVREFEGTGMGLANVRRIVVRHGGSVAAASRPGEGATFTVVLPAVRGDSDPVPHEQPA